MLDLIPFSQDKTAALRDLHLLFWATHGLLWCSLTPRNSQSFLVYSLTVIHLLIYSWHIGSFPRRKHNKAQAQDRAAFGLKCFLQAGLMGSMSNTNNLDTDILHGTQLPGAVLMDRSNCAPVIRSS